MEQTSELMKRLRRIPAERRATFLQRLQTPQAEEREIPLTFRQEQLWIVNRFAELQVAYNLTFGFHLEGKLDVDILTKALNGIFTRQAILRTVFPADENRPTQKILPPEPIDLTVDDLTVHDPSLAQERLNSAIEHSANQVFDFENGPLVRLRLFKLSQHKHLLLWVTHYMVFDSASARLVFQELVESYTAAQEERVPQLPELIIDYADFATWQRRWSAGEEAAKQLRVWQEKLAGWQTTDISPDRPRPTTLDLSGSEVRQAIPEGLFAKCQDLAKSWGIDPEIFFLAVYASLLQRYTNQEEVLVGLPFRMTAPAGLERLVGNGENLWPLRIDVSGDPSMQELVARARDILEFAGQSSNLSFKMLLDITNPTRDPSRLPLVQVAYAYTDQPPAQHETADLTITLEQFPTAGVPFEILLEIESTPTSPQIRVQYFTSLFTEESIKNLLDRYILLLEAIVSQPDTKLARLPIMSASEREHILHDWNLTDIPREAELIHQVFRERVTQLPAAIALVGAHDQKTYEELETNTNQLAWHLQKLDVHPEDRVAIIIDRSLQMVEAILGVLKAGGAYVPIDPTYPDERIETILNDCDAKVVLSQSSLLDRIPAGSWQVVTLDENPTLADYPVTPVDVTLVPENLAYIIYTSGSTGRPKGVAIAHRNVTNFIRTVQRMFDLTPADHILQFASLGFDVSVFEIFSALLTGARLYVTDQDERRSLDALTEIMVKQEITIIDLPPAIMELLDADCFPKLRVAFVGGEAFTGDLTTRWAAGRQFYNGYGPTETTVTVVAKRCEGVWKKSPPIGRAMDNHKAYALDSNLALVPIGIPGELVIAGAGLGRCYWNSPDMTAERFVPDPYGPPGTRLYRTGDLVKWLPSGDLLFLGRIDRQVKIRGQRIELGEIESVLSERAEVRQTVVEAVKDPRGSSVLVAYVVGEQDMEIDHDELRIYLIQKLPSCMIPALFIPLEAVPLTSSGKVDTRALPTVDFSKFASILEDDTHRSPTEKRVAEEIFAPLLAVSHFGIYENFFALGGTSLQAIRVIPRTKKIFGVEMPVAEFFQNPTVAGVATVIDNLLAEKMSMISEDDLLTLLTEVETLSDEEIEQRLGHKE